MILNLTNLVLEIPSKSLFACFSSFNHLANHINISIYSNSQKIKLDFNLLMFNLSKSNLDYIHIVIVGDLQFGSGEIQNKNKGILLELISFEEFLYRKFNRNSPDCLKNTLFIFDKISYSEIVKGFAQILVTLSGGSSTKRHFLSNMDIKLSFFITLILNNNFWVSTFLNSFDNLAKDEYSSKGNFKNEINEFITFYKDLARKTTLDSFNSIQTTSVDFNNAKEVFENSVKESLKLLEENKSKGNDIATDLNKNKTNQDSTNKIKEVKTKNDYKNLNQLLQTSNAINRVKIRKYTINSKREFHTSRVLKEGAVFTYLDEVNKILKDKKSKIKIQETIEEKWIELIKEKLSKPTSESSYHQFSNIITKNAKILENEEGNLKKRFKNLSGLIVKNAYEVLILTLSYLLIVYNKKGYTNLSIEIGNNIAFLLFMKFKKENNKMNFKSFLEEYNLNSNVNLLKLGDYFINYFMNEPTVIFEYTINEKSIDSSSERILTISKDYFEAVKDWIIVNPNSLPMVCKPNLWSSTEFGGFLQNKNLEKSIILNADIHNHKTENLDALYKAVNILNSVKFRINAKFLDYINNEGSFLLEKYLENNGKNNNNNNKALQTNITLKVAEIYKNIPFYLNVNIDWRGRIYTNSFFITYQGGELSRSLIIFDKEELITKSGSDYMDIYGANCYLGSKESLKNKKEWVRNNLDNILKMDKEFIEKADKPILFAAFCLEKISLLKNKKSSFPIFLDATCSGMQHLAVLIRDVNLGALVNLTEKKETDAVSDLYANVVEPLNKNINDYGKANSLMFPNLKNIKLNRKLIKNPIMTQVYNSSVVGIAEQLIEKIEVIKEGDKKLFRFPSKKGFVNIPYHELFKIAEIIKNYVFFAYPSLKEIYDYFINSAKLLSILTLPILWITPHGIQITQEYHKYIDRKVTLSFYGKTRKAVLKEWSENINSRKNNQAIIPNVIHSLDASHLIAVILSSKTKINYPIITIHDCFGTHPNKMEKLSLLVRAEFAKLYLEYDFLKKYHTRLIETLKDNNFEIIKKGNESYVYFNNKYHLIPKKPTLGKLNIKEIEKAINLIC